LYEIYVVTNNVNGKKYVGQTSRGALQRWAQHKSAAKRGYDTYFCRAINKHLPENFSVEVIETTETRQEANEAEIRWIAHLNTVDSAVGYNGMLGGDGSQPTEATKKKLSEIRKKQFEDPEFKARMSAANIGKNHTEEGRQNISLALQGNQYRKGIPHSEEMKEQIRQSVARAYAEGRHAKGAGLKKGTKLGPMSAENKAKISEGVKRIRAEKFWSTKKKELTAA
jgi:group I intron endonuclease